LNVLGVNYVRQTKRYAAEPTVTETSAVEFETVIKKLKSHPKRTDSSSR
jgi:hypothetical protein